MQNYKSFEKIKELTKFIQTTLEDLGCDESFEIASQIENKIYQILTLFKQEQKIKKN